MLISRIAKSNPRISLFTSAFPFSKTRYTSKTDTFESLSSEYPKEYFEQYRKEIEKDTVIRDFRKQIFAKNGQLQEINKNDRELDRQQNQINRMLFESEGNREKASKYSKKIMNSILNNRNMFKGGSGKANKDLFKDYADYSAYKSNYVTIEDRNYLDGDLLERNNTESSTYKYLDSLPSSYKEKQEIHREMQLLDPIGTENMSISQYGQKLQQKHREVQRHDEILEEEAWDNQFKIVNREEIFEDTVFETTEEMLDVDTMETFQLAMLSTQAMNKIYDLYMQGWTVREISRRFGILPARAKFHIWARARLYNEMLPKYGLKFLLLSIQKQQQAMQTHRVVDYGMDLDQMTKTDRYSQITNWQNKRVDVQRSAEHYTAALNKLEKVKKFNKYDMIQVGTHGKENKKYMLKDWKIYRGKMSDQHFLRNKVFRGLMEEKAKIKAVYY